MPKAKKREGSVRPILPDPPQQERALLSTRRLLVATQELLAENGLEKTTLAEVGRRAGYSHGLVTRRFGSKENLLWVLFDSAANELAEPSIKKALEGEPGISLVPMLRALRKGLDTDPLVVRAFYTIMFQSLNSQSMPLLRSRMLDFNPP
jgi:AcrR family transcriptional regulator